jgi:hypothetical protein
MQPQSWLFTIFLLILIPLCKKGKAETHPNPNGTRTRRASPISRLKLLCNLRCVRRVSPFKTRKETGISAAHLKCWLKKGKTHPTAPDPCEPQLQTMTTPRPAFLICRSARFVMMMSTTRSAWWRLMSLSLPRGHRVVLRRRHGCCCG